MILFIEETWMELINHEHSCRTLLFVLLTYMLYLNQKNKKHG